VSSFFRLLSYTNFSVQAGARPIYRYSTSLAEYKRVDTNGKAFEPEMEPIPVTGRSSPVRYRSAGRPVVIGRPVSCRSTDRQKSGSVPSLV